MRTSTTTALLTTGLLLLPGLAWAHPAFNPGTFPAGEPVDAVLVVPHGCTPDGASSHDDAAASPTVELALQHVEGVTVEAHALDGWEIGDDGEALVWSAAGGATAEPILFPVTVTASGEAGDSHHLAALQVCDNGDSVQWSGTPEHEAQYPAVLVEVSAAPADDPVPSDVPSERPTPTASTTPSVIATALPAAEDGGNAAVPVIVGLAVLVAVGAGMLVARRRA